MYFQEFHHHSKDHGLGHKPIPRDSREWPEAWRTLYVKRYPDNPIFPLPDRKPPEADLFSSIRARASSNTFTAKPLSLETLSTLFAYSCGVVGEETQEDTGNGPLALHRRAYPSAGARFPIETYLFNIKGGELPSGIFHYASRQHALERVSLETFSRENARDLFTYEFVQNAAAVIILTAIFHRTTAKYGERGYRYTLLEAGHIGQNISLVSGALGLSANMLGGTRDTAVEKALDIDGITESVVYACALGERTSG